MTESIDIYDANLAPAGVMDRLDAHMSGRWHQTFHCWVVTSNLGGCVLFQGRSSEMANYPNMLDVSAAGHLTAGESMNEGIREVSEELGLPFSMTELQSLGYRVEVADQPNGQRNREYQAVFMVRCDTPLSAYRPQVEEVASLYWLRIEDGYGLFAEGSAQATLHGITYDPPSSRWLESERVVSADDFLPRIQRYYLTISVMAERLLEGRRPLAIS